MGHRLIMVFVTLSKESLHEFVHLFQWGWWWWYKLHLYALKSAMGWTSCYGRAGWSSYCGFWGRNGWSSCCGWKLTPRVTESACFFWNWILICNWLMWAWWVPWHWLSLVMVHWWGVWIALPFTMDWSMSCYWSRNLSPPDLTMLWDRWWVRISSSWGMWAWLGSGSWGLVSPDGTAGSEESGKNGKFHFVCVVLFC